MLQITFKTWHVILFGLILLLWYMASQQFQNSREKPKVKTREVYSGRMSKNIFLADQLNCKDFPLETQRMRHSSYWLVQNYVRGSISQNIGCADSITYATNGDYTFLKHLVTLTERWLAPVSIAVFAPGYDFNRTMESIQYLRNCLPESELIQKFVTFHVYFPEDHMPPYVPFSENDALKWPYDCDIIPYGKEKDETSYRRVNNLTYPINVGRNIARKAVNTYFVLASDLELFPSLGLVDKFLKMVERNISLVVDAPGVQLKPRVFPLAVFELKAYSKLPNTKEELVIMYQKGYAQTFHRFLCNLCHTIPEKKKWLNLRSVVDMSVLAVRKREKSFFMWEPFYISDNKEPIFDERVHWEGQSNKRIQGYAMCLLGYEYHVLNDGFLVHYPGIRRVTKDCARRKLYVARMNALIHYKAMEQHRRLFGIRVNGKYNKCSV